MDILKLYLQEVEQYPKLTNEETEELFQKYWKDKDQRAYDRLVECNLRYVVWIYFSAMHGSMNNAMDCIQAGNIALMRSVQHYNGSSRFGQYAFFNIRRAIIREWYKLFNIVHISEKQYYDLMRYKQDLYLAELTNDPEEIKKVAEALGMTVEEVRKNQQMLDQLKVISDVQHGNSIDIDTKKSFGVESTHELSLREYRVQEEQRYAKLEVELILKGLKPRDREILKMYYGIDRKSPMTMREIAKETNMTFQNVSVIIKRTINEIKKDYKGKEDK